MRKPQSRLAVGTFLLVLFGLLHIFAASETLHKAFHPDADHPDHHCAVSVFKQGQVEASAGWVSVASLEPVILPAPEALEILLVAVDYRLLPGRAPPSSLL